MEVTRSTFIDEYMKTLVQMFPWATDKDKLEGFISSCISTLDGANTWNHDGPAVHQSWTAIGMKSKPTLKALRALK